jgi:hypothetical protein
VSTQHKGALISPELAAKVHWAIGRASGESASEAVSIGSELIEEIQQALTGAYRSGVEAVRRTQAHLGGSVSGSHVTVLNPGGAGGTSASEDYRDGAVV